MNATEDNEAALNVRCPVCLADRNEPCNANTFGGMVFVEHRPVPHLTRVAAWRRAVSGNTQEEQAE